MSPNLECLCRAVVRSAAGEFKSFAVHKFHSCNGILAGRITGALIFFAIHFINKCCECESKRMQKNRRPQMNNANLLPF